MKYPSGHLQAPPLQANDQPAWEGCAEADERQTHDRTVRKTRRGRVEKFSLLFSGVIFENKDLWSLERRTGDGEEEKR
ncbi:hypothetical protein EYF80_045964 [Liparis tanakae]|uniref:Uncharacterized protein n=1 Tax=Liparis tanakae TaxID=230148 RepID=A0A4Z2FSU9_9TELE|nr:hypothetical protein EYF80_045964 [Liparis tanakae]